jgi:hypothetical protein
MAVPTYPSAITLTDIQTEFGGSNPASLNEYYSGGTYVGSGIANSTGTVIPTSGAISYLNFSGAVAWLADPTQPTVTQTYWHGVWSGFASYDPDAYFISNTGHLLARINDARTIVALDGSGVKVWANTFTDGVGGLPPFVYQSNRNPNRGYLTQNIDRGLITKLSNTGVGLIASNANYGSSNINSRIWMAAATSGTTNSNTSIYPMVTSNTNFANSDFTICKLNATDMTTIEWAKSVNVQGSDVTNNGRFQYVFTNQNESAVIIYGQRSTLNTVVVILDAATGATQQSWQTVPNLGILPKPTNANNLALVSGFNLWLKSNTGANVATLYISNSSWRAVSYVYDVDVDDNIYIGAHNNPGNVPEIVGMVAKYNSAGTRQWQVRISTTNTANAVQIMYISASNTRTAIVLREWTRTHDGKKWYQSYDGEYRVLYISSASGNTGTMGPFVLASNTQTVFGANANLGMWSYTYSPRTNTNALTFSSHSIAGGTANSNTFTKTAL